MNGCGRKIGKYNCCTIITGDAKELAPAIPDESVDLIFTDPVYDRIEDYRWLAETAVRVLKSDGNCLTWLSKHYLLTVGTVMCPPLRYVWLLEWQKYGKPRMGPTGVSVLIPCLWLGKQESRARKRIADWIGHHFEVIEDNSQKHQLWNKPEPVIAHWLTGFSTNSALVWDAFCGGGTVPAVCKMLGRHYLAFEIDPGVAERARERVRNTQPPLFVMQPEQVGMAI